MKYKQYKQIIESYSYADDLLIKALSQMNFAPIDDALEKGADINVLNGYPLGISAATGKWEMFRYLITKGANVNIAIKYLMDNNNVVTLPKILAYCDKHNIPYNTDDVNSRDEAEYEPEEITE